MAFTATTILIPLRQPVRAEEQGATHALLVQLGGNGQSQPSTVPVDMCVLIDCGWFMHNEQIPSDSKGSSANYRSKLDAAKDAVESLLARLPESHTLSVVAFGESATCCATRLIRGQDEVFRKAVGSLAGRASSHLAVGLKEAARVLLSGDSQAQKKILLLQGGQVKNIGAAVLATEELASQHISLDVIGIGADASRLLAQHLVSAGNGRSWPAVTAKDIRNAAQEALGAATDTIAHDISVAVGVCNGWSVVGCVRSGAENLPLYCSAAENCCDVTVFAGGVRQREPIDLWFYFKSLEHNPRPEQLRGTVMVNGKSRHSAIRRDFDEAAGPGSPSIQKEDLRCLATNCLSAELKMPERSLYLASQHEDRPSLARHLRLLQTLAAQCGLNPVQLVVEQLIQSVGQNGTMATDLLNTLASRTSGAPYRMVPLPAALALGPIGAAAGRGTQLEGAPISPPDDVTSNSSPSKEPARSIEVPANTAEIARAEQAAITAMLEACRESLATHSQLVSALAAIDSARADAKATALSTFQRLFTASAPDSQSWLVSAQEATRGFSEALKGAVSAFLRIHRLTERDENLKSVVASAVKCAQFYGWENAGWMGSLDALRARGDMLRRLLEEKT